jgi:flagellar hook-length control protein FliK
MNMAISSTPATSGKSAVSATTGSTAGSATGSGFAGALVQAIDGSGNAAGTSGNGLSLPVGLAGLLGQLGLDTAGEQSQDLLEMLSQLVSQLQQLEQGADELSEAAGEQLAGLLASLQGLLQQLSQNQPAQAEVLTEAPEIAITTDPTQQLSPKQTLVKALRETLQQLASIVSGKDDNQLVANFAGQLKTVLDSLAVQTTNPNPTSSADSIDVAKAQPTGDAIATTGKGNAIPAEAANQAATVVVEPRRPAQALRDPIWRFNLTDSTDTANTNSQVAVVPSVAAAEEAGNSEAQPAWTFMQNDPLANPESLTGKASVPVQVPVQQFAEQMEKFLVKQFSLTQGNGISEAKLSLTPEHLGQVDIRIVMHNGQLTAQFITDNAMARELLDNQMAQLKTALSSQGLQVERLEVVQQSPSSTGTSFMQQEHRQSNSGNGNGSNGGNGDTYEDPAVFAAELERNSSLKEFGFGSSLNVTA